MLAPISIGPHEIPVPVMLAPMAGVTDRAFRTQARAFGVGHVVTEMVTAAAYNAAQGTARARAALEPSEGLISVQIAGREPEEIAEAALRAEAGGAPIIDINMGCPAKKVTTGYAGSALMRVPDHALRLIEAVRGAVQVPVTLKMRLGWDRDSLTAPEIARGAEALGVSMIVIHARTRQDFYRGRADWAQARETVEAVTIPVIVNGDIDTPSTARRALAASGAVGVMVGRGANGRPWAPAEIMADLLGEAFTAPTPREALALAVAHHQAMIAEYGPDVGLRAARKHLSWRLEPLATRLPDRAALRARLMRLDAPEAVWQALEDAQNHVIDDSPLTAVGASGDDLDIGDSGFIKGFMGSEAA